MPTNAVPLRRKTLLIDDDDMIAVSLRHYLELEGRIVDVALHGSAAEMLMASQQYGVIIVDPYLTGGVRQDSAALLQTICRLQPTAAIIILTAYDSPALERVAAECHVAALLTKPQAVVTLSRLVASFDSITSLPSSFVSHPQPRIPEPE